jgi:transposase
VSWNHGESTAKSFKQESVQLTKQAGGAMTQVAKDLGINAAKLGRWCREAGRRGAKAFPGTGTPHDQELARLKRDLALVTRERDFLKEAAAFFANTSR